MVDSVISVLPPLMRALRRAMLLHHEYGGGTRTGKATSQRNRWIRRKRRILDQSNAAVLRAAMQR